VFSKHNSNNNNNNAASFREQQAPERKTILGFNKTIVNGVAVA